MISLITMPTPVNMMILLPLVKLLSEPSNLIFDIASNKRIIPMVFDPSLISTVSPRKRASISRKMRAFVYTFFVSI
jgi:hypothetical protein